MCSCASDGSPALHTLWEWCGTVFRSWEYRRQNTNDKISDSNLFPIAKVAQSHAKKVVAKKVHTKKAAPKVTKKVTKKATKKVAPKKAAKKVASKNWFLDFGLWIVPELNYSFLFC